MDQEAHEARYDGRPLLVLLENYALAVIGQLPAEREVEVAGAAARLLGGVEADWMATVARVSGLPPDFEQRVQDL
jgi:hypothetical protein